MGNQMLGSDKILRINNFPLIGNAQSFDWAPAFNSEDIFELGRTEKVATAQELETSGSFEVLSVGGTAGILARMIVDRDSGTQAFQGYKFNEAIISGTASSGTTTTLVTTGLTGSAHVDYYLVITAGTNVGESRKITANTTTTFTVTPAFSSAIDATSVFKVSGGPNKYVFDEADVKECMFDIMTHEKSDQLSWDRTLVLPRVFLTSIAGRADANGSASETYSFGGDFVIGAPSPYHALSAIPATRTTSSTATLVDIAITNATHGLMYFYIDERRLRTTNTDSVYATLGAAGVVTITGMTIPTTAAMRALVWDNTSPSTTFPVLAAEDRASSAFFVRGWMADLYIAPADADNPTQNEKWLKVQSVDWNIDLRTEALRQIAFNAAGTAIYCRLPTYPLAITANASTYESDWADWLAILDPTAKPMGSTGTDPYGETFDFAPNSLLESFALVVQYRTKTGVLIQTWKFNDMVVDGYGTRVNVGGRAEINWSMRGTGFTVTGNNV